LACFVASLLVCWLAAFVYLLFRFYFWVDKPGLMCSQLEVEVQGTCSGISVTGKSRRALIRWQFRSPATWADLPPNFYHWAGRKFEGFAQFPIIEGSRRSHIIVLDVVKALCGFLFSGQKLHRWLAASENCQSGNFNWIHVNGP